MRDNGGNIYIPMEATLMDVRPLTEDVKLYTIEIGKTGKLGKTGAPVSCRAGQFFMVSAYGFGEVPMSVASLGEEPLTFCIRKVGSVTSALHSLKAGSTVGIRGPYGNGFPVKKARGRDVVFMAGGMGIVPLRPLIHEIIQNQGDYGRLFMLYGYKRPEDMLFGSDIADWVKAGLTLIHGLRSKKPKGTAEGNRPPHNLDKVDIDFSGATAFISGPHSMIDLSMKELSLRGIPDDRIITTLEAHMKCGVGKCGHCYRGSKYICTDGPVFSLKELRTRKS